MVRLPAVRDSASSALSPGKISSCLCTICKGLIQISCNKTSNIIGHIKSMHYDTVMMPFECLPEHSVKKKMSEWESLKNPTSTTKVGVVTTCKVKVQATMNQMQVRNVGTLKVVLVESMCMGYLPATLTHNPGMV